MTSVRIPPVLTGAALALVLATPGFAQQQSSDQQGANQQKQASQIPVEVTTPEPTAEAARNAGAAGQVVQRLEEAQQALEQGDTEAAREALGQAKEMLQKARVVGSPERLLQIEAHLEGATAALEAGDMGKAQAAIGAAAEGMIEVEQASARQGLQQGTAQHATAQGGQQDTQQATGQDSQQAPQQPTAQGEQQSGQQGTQQATGQSGQQTTQATDQSGQQATVLGQQDQQPAMQSDGQSSQDALRNARDALEMARQEVESALQAVQDAEAALQQGDGGGMAGTDTGTSTGSGISVTVLDEGETGATGDQPAASADSGQTTTSAQGQTGATGDQQTAASGSSQVTTTGQGQTASTGDQQAATTEDGAQITVVEEGETEALPAASDAQQQVPQPQPQLSAEETTRLLATGDREIGQAAEMLTITIGDLSGRDVVTFDGERVGEIGQIVTNGENVYAIVEHGGFLGIGENKVAIPADRLGLRGEEIVLLGLSQEQLERIPEYDFDSGQELSQEQSIEIGRYN